LLQTKISWSADLHFSLLDFIKFGIELTEKAFGAPPRTTTSWVGRGYFGSTCQIKCTWILIQAMYVAQIYIDKQKQTMDGRAPHRNTRILNWGRP
jgi:hypothetical protein